MFHSPAQRGVALWTSYIGLRSRREQQPYSLQLRSIKGDEEWRVLPQLARKPSMAVSSRDIALHTERPVRGNVCSMGSTSRRGRVRLIRVVRFPSTQVSGSFANAPPNGNRRTSFTFDRSSKVALIRSDCEGSKDSFEQSPNGKTIILKVGSNRLMAKLENGNPVGTIVLETDTRDESFAMKDCDSKSWREFGLRLTETIAAIRSCDPVLPLLGAAVWRAGGDDGDATNPDRTAHAET